ncbi:MAG: DMT family transporter [Gammaproteobacteria bacterium]|nr:DMT family transporter [Gammaproteobacteria bacterium]
MTTPSATSPQHALPWQASLLLIVITLFWGAQQVLVKATILEIPPVTLAAIRFTTASVLLLVIFRALKWTLMIKEFVLVLAIASGLTFVGSFISSQLGLAKISATRLTILLYTAPLWTAFFLSLLGDKLNWRQWMGIVIAFFALSLAFGGYQLFTSTHTSDELLGDLFGILSGLFWAFTTILLRRTRLSQIPPYRQMFYQIATSAMIFPILAWSLNEPADWHFTAFNITSLAIQVTLGSASFLIWTWMLSRYPTAILNSYVFLAPVFTLIISALWLNEPLTWEILFSLMGIALGIYWVNQK